MTSLTRLGTILLVAALALPLVPASHAQERSGPHPWKLAYAKRLAEEKLERIEAREKREAARRKLAREERRRGKATVRGGLRARPARPDAAPAAPYVAAPAPRAGLRFGRTVISPPANVIVNDRTGDGTISGQSETAIVSVGDRMVAAWNDGQGFPADDTQGWATSSDGGLTWVDGGPPPNPTLPAGGTSFVWTSDPVLTVDERSGAIYYSALCDLLVSGQLRSGIGVLKGRWSGNTFTWTNGVVARHNPWSNDFLDKQWIVADSVSHRVFLTCSRFLNDFSRIEFQFADSTLASWSSPQLISLNIATENGWVQGSRPIVDGDGRVYVMYYLIGQGEADYYRVARSQNGGASFTAPVTAATIFTNFGTGAPGFNRPIGVQFAGLAVDRSHGAARGRLYLSWAESINWLDDVDAIGQGTSKSEVEPNNSIFNATTAVTGQTLRGSISGGTDIDLFAIPLTAGQHFIAAADSVQSGAVFRLRMFAGDGATALTFTTFDATVNPTAQNPNGIPSGWLFTAPSDGTYLLRIDSQSGTGAYRVRLGSADRNGERGRDQRDVFVASSDDGTTWSTPVRLNEDPVGFDNWLPEVTVAPDGGIYSAWYDFHDAPASTSGGQSHVYLARSGDGAITWTTLGAVTDVASAWPPGTSNIEPNQGDYIALFANNAYVWPCWADMRNGNPDVFTGRVPIIPNGVQVAFESVQVGASSVSIDWQATPADTVTMRLYRSEDGGPFQYEDLLYFDTGGAATYTDTTVVADHGYSYRLGKFVNGVEIFHGQVSVFLPLVFPLSLAPPRPNPVVGNSFGVAFSLATDEPAALILHDIGGREVFRRSVSLGRGSHTLSLPVDAGLHQGLYVLTIRQGDRNTSTRFHLVR